MAQNELACLPCMVDTELSTELGRTCSSHMNFQQTSQGLYQHLQQGLQPASQQPALLHHPNASLHTLLHEAARQGVQPALQQPAQMPALLHPAAGSVLLPNTLTAAQHASSSLPSWWSDPFASASAAAVAAAGSSVDPAAPFTRALTGTAGAAGSTANPAGLSANPVGSSANPAGSSANPAAFANLAGSSFNPAALPADPGALVPICYGLRRCNAAARMPDRTAEKPQERSGSASSTHGQATRPVDLDAARGNARAYKRSACDRHGSPSMLLLNRPFTRPLTAATAPSADATADKGNHAHDQVVRHLLACRECSKADQASDLRPSSSNSAHAAPEAATAGDGNVPTAAGMTAAAKPGDTGSLLPTPSAPPRPLPPSRLKQLSLGGTRRPISGRRASFKAQAAEVAKLKADTKNNAAAAVAAAAAILGSMAPAVPEPQQQDPSNAPLQPVSYPQIKSATGGPQHNPWGPQAGMQNSAQDSRSGSLGPTQRGLPGGSAPAMPPPAPRQPTEAAAGNADLLWSQSAHSRDMHSLGAGLLHIPDPEDRRGRLQDFGGSGTMQSNGEHETALHLGQSDWGRSDSIVRMSSLPGKAFCHCCRTVSWRGVWVR